MKSLLLSLLLLLSINALAQEIELNGIMYSVDNGIATLKYVNPMADSISKNSESVFSLPETDESELKHIEMMN